MREQRLEAEIAVFCLQHYKNHDLSIRIYQKHTFEI